MEKGMKPSELLVKAVKDPKDPLDIKREFSSGPGGAKTFADVKQNQRKFGIELKNDTAEDKVIVFGKASRSIYGTTAKALTALGVATEGLFVKHGDLHTDGSGKKVTANAVNQGRNVDELINYVANASSQVDAISIHSSTANGANPDTSNLSENLRQTWTSPFENPKDKYLALSEYQNNKVNSPQFVNIDCRRDGFPVIWSNEHFFMVTVKAGTKLKMTFSFGLQDSRPQRFHRAVSKANETVNRIEQFGGHLV